MTYIDYPFLTGTLKCQNTTCENDGRCIYVPGDEEIECICEHPFVGDRCQYEGRPMIHLDN